MSHPSEAVLIAFVDQELERDQRRNVDAHLQGCGLCRHALRDLQGAMAGLTVELALVDAAEPGEWRTMQRPPVPRPASARGTDGRAASDGSTPRPPLALHDSSRSMPRSRTSGAKSLGASGIGANAAHRIGSRAMRWAAALVLVGAGGAAAMVAPRVRGMFRSAPETVAAPSAAPAVPVVPASRSARSAAAAVSILPDRGEATIALSSHPAGGEGRVMVQVSERRDVQVTVTAALDAGALPRFTSAEGRLEVRLVGSGSVVLVELPSSLRTAHITHEGRTIITVRGTDVVPASARTTGVVIGAAHEP